MSSVPHLAQFLRQLRLFCRHSSSGLPLLSPFITSTATKITRTGNLATWMVLGAAAGLLIGYDIREIALVPVPWGMTLALSLFGVASPSRNGFTWVGYGTRSH